MEATSASETSVNFYQTTRRNNPEDNIFIGQFILINLYHLLWLCGEFICFVFGMVRVKLRPRGRYTDFFRGSHQPLQENYVIIPKSRTNLCRSQWPCGLRRGSWPVGCWDREFESRSRHGCLSASFCVVLSCVGRGLATG
jgi:hypothetical protein